MGKRSKSPTEVFLENATPEEQRAFSEALLASRATADAPAVPQVPERFIPISRLLSVIVVVVFVVSEGWSESLLWELPTLVVWGAVAWYPNETANAVGYLNLGAWVRRPSNPQFLFVVAWIFLSILGIGSVLQWF